MANEGLGWNPRESPSLKMVHDPGGDWHPGKGAKLQD